MARREPAAKLVTMALAWVAIFAAGFVLFTFRDDFGWVAQRLKAEAIGTPVQQGRETRIPMAIDGHFWVEGAAQRPEGQIPGRQRRDDDHHRSRHGACAPEWTVSPRRDQFVRTGNGIIRVSTGRADEIGGRRDRAPATSGCRSRTTTI